MNPIALFAWIKEVCRRWIALLPLLFCLAGPILLMGCSLPQVSAESRLFLNLSVTFLGDYALPQQTVANSLVGGLSALAYDRTGDRFYALADDDSDPRFYTLALQIQVEPETDPGAMPYLANVSIEGVTHLRDNPALAAQPNLDGEGLALTPKATVFVSSEGNLAQKISPRLTEFQVETGTWQRDLPLPPQYWTLNDDQELIYSVSPNLGLEALTLNTEGDRLFAALEMPLSQDLHPEAETQNFSRFLHYWIGEPEPILIAEHLYPLDPAPAGSLLNGLTDMVSIDNAGHFLTLERAYSPLTGFSAMLYQIATGVATDTASVRALLPDPRGTTPILKKPLLNLKELGIPIQNLEGLSLGPQLPDGSRSLLLVSDNNFDATVPSQFLLFQLQNQPQNTVVQPSKNPANERG